LDDDGKAARDANKFVERKIDDFGEWTGILDPREEEEGPVSVPMDAKISPPEEETSIWDDDGEMARDANTWVEDKIDGFGEWLGILEPREEDEGPVSVPFE
jgi:hypothetical protein